MLNLDSGGGIGNSPDEDEDTLIVEFKALGLEGDIWTRVWEQKDLNQMTLSK